MLIQFLPSLHSSRGILEILLFREILPGEMSLIHTHTYPHPNATSLLQMHSVPRSPGHI